MLFSALPSPDVLKQLLERAQSEHCDASIIERLKTILHFSEHQSIAETCALFGVSRSTFYRWVERFDPENVQALADRGHEALAQREPIVAPEMLELIRRYRTRYPNMGKEKISFSLQAEHGISLSSSTVGRVIERECLYFADTPYHWKKRQMHERGVQKPLVDQASVASLQSEHHKFHTPNPNIQTASALSLWTWIWRTLVVSSVVVANIALLLLTMTKISQSDAVPLHAAAPNQSLLP